MKAVILAGGAGARITDESHTRPKPMEDLGGQPILWHILKMYSAQGVNDFIICVGRHGYLIKEFFANYFLHTADVTFDIRANSMEVHESSSDPWRVTLLDTGDETGTGGRLKRAAPHVAGDEAFCMSYGDTVSDLDFRALIEEHRRGGKLATLTAVRAEPRFGILGLNGDDVYSVHESAQQGGWVNGGFYVLSPKSLNFVADERKSRWEQDPLNELVSENQLHAYRHAGFWQPMDTPRDKHLLETLWASGKAPWKTW